MELKRKRTASSLGFGGGRPFGFMPSLRFRQAGMGPRRIGFLKKRRYWKRRIHPRPYFYYQPPSHLTVRLKATAQHTLTGGASSESFYIRPNSAFNPWGIIAATQAPWFDKYAGIYNYYMCTSASLNISFSSLQTADSIRVCCYPSRAAAATSFTNAAGQVGSKQFIIRLTSTSRTAGCTVFFNFANYDGSPLDESQDGALTSASPTHAAYFYVVVGTVNGGNLSTDSFQLTLIQNVVFYGRENAVDS